MNSRTILICLLLFCNLVVTQEVSLPADLRQHTLTQYNASLFNPVFSLDRNNPQSVSFWTRWQWQQVDADPTTLFLNYSRKIDERSGFGAGFFQHNTGIYFNTGGVVNYAYEVKLNPIIKLAVGANLFGFQQQLADTRFLPDPDIFPIPLDVSDDFILQLAPGFNLSVENFSFSMASENLFDYNVTDGNANTETSDKIFMGMVSYNFPILANDSTAYLRPSLYLRTIPEQQNQIGLNTLFSTQKYWAQAGYNNFYGISVGAGGTFFNRISLGALVEFGTSASLNTKDASFEIIASYFLGNPRNRRAPVATIFDTLDEEVLLLNEEEEASKMRETLENAQKIAFEKKNIEEKEDEDEDEESLEKRSKDIPIKEVDNTKDDDEPQIDKKEARKLAQQKRTLNKARVKDSLDQIKKGKEALVLAEKERQQQEDKQEELAKVEAKVPRKQKVQEAKKAEEEAKRTAELYEQQRLQKAAEELEKVAALKEAERELERQRKDSLAQVEKMEAVTKAKNSEAQQVADSIANTEAQKAIAAAERLRTAQQQDSIQETQAKPATMEAQQKQLEEIKKVKEEVTLQAGEKYEEVTTEDGLVPGFYLIANVFGTKKYFDAFIQDLKKKGIEPGAFLRSTNNYNYAYLKRYTTISAARKARDSNFDGKYEGKTWIFRVVGEE